MNTYTKPLLGLLSGAVMLAPSFASAEIKCECRMFGSYVSVGEKVCMNTPNGAKMARCEMMQNNPSWVIEDDECPLALNQTVSPDPITELALKL